MVTVRKSLVKFSKPIGENRRKVKLINGVSLTGTNNYSVMTDNSGKVIVKQLKDVKIGDVVFITM